MIRRIDGLEAALAASDAPMNPLDHHGRGCPYGDVTATLNANGADTELFCGPECLATPPWPSPLLAAVIGAIDLYAAGVAQKATPLRQS